MCIFLNSDGIVENAIEDVGEKNCPPKSYRYQECKANAKDNMTDAYKYQNIDLFFYTKKPFYL